MTLCVAIWSTTFLNHQWWLLVFLVYLLLRIITLKDRQVLIAVCILLLLTSGRCYVQNKYQSNITPHQAQSVQTPVRVNADAWRVNGNHAQAIGSLAGHKVLLQIFLKSRHQQQMLLTTNRPQIVKVNGELSPIPVASNRYEFDAQRYYAEIGTFQQIRGQMVSMRTYKARSLITKMHCLRAQSKNYFRSLPQPIGIYAERLLLGVNDPQLQSTLQFASTLGIIHLFCISGMHVMVLLAILRYLLAHMQITREHRQWVEILILPCLLIIGGAGNGLSRAIIMTELQLLINKLAARHSADCWSLGLLIHLAIQPGLLVNVGGQLTYLLSFALRVIVTRDDWRRAIAMNVIALPAVLANFYQVHLISLLTNIIIVPLFTVIILPGVLMSVFIWPLLPFIVSWFNQLLRTFDCFLGWLAHLPGMIVFGRIPGIVALVLTILSLLIFNQHRINHNYVYMLVTIYCLSFLFIHCPLTGEVTFFDIGQGDCALIRTPFNRKVVMIDTGGQLHFRQPSWARGVTPASRAERTSVNYLKSRGITQIDALCLSHHDTDHIGFTTDIVKEFKVRCIYVPKGMEQQKRFLRHLAGHQNVEGIIADEKLPANLLTLHPLHKGQGNNEDSAVLWGTYGKASFIFMGDLDRKGELQVLKQYPQLKADIIKLGHHGSHTASDPRFLQALRPSLAIISAGRRNRYGHPHQVTLNNLKRLCIPYLSTQRYGMISYIYLGSYGRIRTELTGDELSWMQTPLKSN